MENTLYPELNKIAEKLAGNILNDINVQAQRVESEMPYKSQWVLERIVEILQNQM